MAIGFIGVGNMGGALARRLQRQQQLRVYDLDKAAVTRLAAEGATPCANLRELAAGCDTILLCLPASEHVRAVIFGEDGLAGAARAGTLIVDQTTGDPLATRAMAAQLAKLGIELIDAPVSGGPKGADDGRIAIMVGATPDQYTRILPTLLQMGPNVFHAGEVGAGQVIKLANNMLHHSQRLLSLEVISLAVKNGIKPQTAVDIIMASSGRNYYIEHNMAPRVLAGNMQSGFTLELLHKDVRLATQLGVDSGVPMLFSSLVREFYQMSMNELGRDTQVNEVARLFDRRAGTQMVPANSN